jgi:hypothetical protein
MAFKNCTLSRVQLFWNYTMHLSHAAAAAAAAAAEPASKLLLLLFDLIVLFAAVRVSLKYY